jgi:hypothetical protein
MRKPILFGIFIIFLFSCDLSAETRTWNLTHNEMWTTVETVGTADINELRIRVVLKLMCNKKDAALDFEIADWEKVQQTFDLRTFEGPDAPTRDLALTTIDLVGVGPKQSMSFHQNGFISPNGRFVVAIGGASLAKMYKRMSEEGNLLRIRIRSYQNPRQFIVSEFSLNEARKVISILAAAYNGPRTESRKPASIK